MFPWEFLKSVLLGGWDFIRTRPHCCFERNSELLPAVCPFLVLKIRDIGCYSPSIWLVQRQSVEVRHRTVVHQKAQTPCCSQFHVHTHMQTLQNPCLSTKLHAAVMLFLPIWNQADTCKLNVHQHMQHCINTYLLADSQSTFALASCKTTSSTQITTSQADIQICMFTPMKILPQISYTSTPTYCNKNALKHIYIFCMQEQKIHKRCIRIHIYTKDRNHSAAFVFMLAWECQSLSSLPPNRCLIVFGLWFNCWIVFQPSEGIENTPGLQLQQMPALKQGGFWNHCSGGNCLHRKP